MARATPSSRTSVPRGFAPALIRFVKRHSAASERRKAVRIESGWLHLYEDELR